MAVTRSPQPLPWRSMTDILVMLLWGLMLVRYWVTGKLSLLLHPDYQWLSNGAAILLLGLAAMRSVQLARALVEGTDGVASQGHFSLFPRRFSTLLLIGVAVFGLIFNPRPFSSETALQRGLGESVGQTRSQPQRFALGRAPSERTILDWVRTLNVYPEPDAYEGQSINVTGFVIYPPGWPPSTFMVSRFVLTCCAADAYPIGLPVQLLDGQERPPQDQWLTVTGIAQTANIGGKRQLAIDPQNIEVVPEPANPYEY